ncbi:MAG: fibronectin type III domain-containing protein [Chitinophagales bacterium]|nr:fibronectin type III domain-containing protein [Chitinophagales bacterium]
MSIITRPKYGFGGYSDSTFADKATQIHSMMSVCPLYPAPPIAYPALLALVQNFNNAIVAAINRDKVKVTQEREIREELDQALKTLAIYMMTITDVKLEIELSGFDVVERGAPIGIPVAPQDVHTASVAQGTVHIEWKRVHGAFNYVVEATTGDPESPTTVWSNVAVPTQTKCTVENLNALTYYWFRVRANGAAGLSLPSAPAIGLSA